MTNLWVDIKLKTGESMRLRASSFSLTLNNADKPVYILVGISTTRKFLALDVLTFRITEDQK